MKRKILTLFMVVCMIASYIPTIAFAAEESATEPEVITEEVEEISEETAEASDVEVSNEVETKAEEIPVVDESSEEEIVDEEPSTSDDYPYNWTVHWKADGDENDDTTEEWQTEEHEALENPIPVKFTIEGASSVQIALYNVTSRTAEAWQTITNGQTITLENGAQYMVKGISGKYISATSADTLAEAKDEDYPDISVNSGDDVGFGINGDESAAVVYIKVASDRANLIIPEKVVAETTPVKGMPFNVGDTGTGYAKWVSSTLKNHHSPITVRITSGWLKKYTKVKTVTATCYSGPTHALSRYGTYKYDIKVLSIKDGNAKIRVRIHPAGGNDYYPGTVRGASFQHHSTVINTKGVDQSMQFTVEKSSELEHFSHPENYSLKGAKYQVFKNNGEACKIYDLKEGKETSEDAIITIKEDGTGNKVRVKVDPKGEDKFYIQEISQDDNKNFALAKNFYVDYSIGEKQIKGEDGELKTLKSSEVPITGYITLAKKAANTTTDFVKEAPNNYTLEGAKFEVFTDKACTTPAKDYLGNVITFTTKADGSTDMYRVDVGDYYVKEVTAPKGYLSNSEVFSVKVAADGSNDRTNPATFTVTDNPTYSSPAFKIYKYDPEGVKGWDRMVGAYYQVSYYDIACWYKGGTSPKVEDLDPVTLKYTTPTRKWIFKTKETPSSDPNYKYAAFDWLEDDAVSVTLDAPMTTAGGVTYKAGQKITSDPFYVENGKRIMPIGFYTIEEIKAPVGVSRNPLVVHGKVYQPEMGEEAQNYIEGDSLRVNYAEPKQNVTISVQKVDAETGKNVPETGAPTPVAEVKNIALKALNALPDLVLDTRLASFASLAGAKYNVYFNNDETPMPELVGTITTDENGYAELTARNAGRQAELNKALEPGNYYVEEVSPSPGYVLDKLTLEGDDTVQVLDHEIEVILSYDSDGNPVTKIIGGTYENGELKANTSYTGDIDNEMPEVGNVDSRHVFLGRVEEKNALNFKFTTTSPEWHHVTEFTKTDATTGEELPGAILQVINSDNEIVQNWVSTTEPYIIKGLPNGDYKLREITAPYGYDIAEDVPFTIVDNVIKNRVEMKNKPITIGTQAMDEKTKAHQGVFGVDESIIDTVKVTGLYTGRTYTLRGILMDKATNAPMKDKDGNDITGQLLDASGNPTDSFVAEGDEMELKLKFDIDSSQFTTNTTTVAFEYLDRVVRIEGRDETNDFPGEEFPHEIQKHDDINDEAQTIHYGGIVSTQALDKDSKSHNILAAGNVTIVDTVKFENLSPEEKYVVTGELFDKTTGQLLGVTGRAEFTPDAPDGTVEVEFTFDATELKNHDLVVFESLEINGILVHKHENPDDEEQTMYVPEIHTTATDVTTEDHISYGNEDVHIVDVVEYKNLIPGQEYEMNGTLMNKETGEPLEADGEVITATATFTPTETDGTVEIEFVFNGVDLTGTTTVAFEECTINKVPVAVHADLEDEAQTVDIPEIGTQAALVKKTVEDTVMYSNLQPGKYVMRGWLVDTKTGKKLKDSDGEFEFEVTEPHSSGDVVVELPVTGYSKLGGYKLTAFEELYYVKTVEDEDGSVIEEEYIVADHKDTDDDGQTVKIPGGPKTGDTKSIYIFSGIFAVAVIAGIIAFFARRKKSE